MENKLIVILGPTASGKTKLAVDLASKINAEIISADSRQVYRGMNIGTGKDYDDYLHFFEKAPFAPAGIAGLHLVDILEAGENYNVAFFQKDFERAYQNIVSRNKTPILCGGTGMYIEAVLRNHTNTQVAVNQSLRDKLEQKNNAELNEIFQKKYKDFNQNADISTRKRLIRAIEIGEFKIREMRSEIGGRGDEIEKKIHHTPLIFGISIPTEIRRERITKRLHQRLENGMIAEVKGLLESGISEDQLIFYGLEYKFITQFLMRELAYDEMVKRLEIAIHQFAKRQMTFFRSMERKDLKINWLDGLKPVSELSEEILNCIKMSRNGA